MPDFDEMRNAVLRAAGKGRLPLDPLLTLWDGHNFTDEEIATRCGVTRAVVVSWHKRGLSLRAADRVACHVGLHPILIWGRDYWNAR